MAQVSPHGPPAEEVPHERGPRRTCWHMNVQDEPEATRSRPPAEQQGASCAGGAGMRLSGKLRLKAAAEKVVEEQRSSSPSRSSRFSAAAHAMTHLARGPDGHARPWRLAGAADLGPKGLDRFVIHPSSRFKTAAELLVSICVLYTAVVAPVRCGGLRLSITHFFSSCQIACSHKRLAPTRGGRARRSRLVHVAARPGDVPSSRPQGCLSRPDQ